MQINRDGIMVKIVRIIINLIMIWSMEEIYYSIHMKLRYYNGTIFSGIILPSLIILIATAGVNYLLNKIAYFKMSLNYNFFVLTAGLVMVSLG